MIIVFFALPLIIPILSVLTTCCYYLQYRKSLLSSILFGFAFAVIFLNYIPDIGNDSVRHMALLEIYRELSFIDCLNLDIYHNLFVWNIWNWLVSKVDIPYILPASGAFIGYGVLSFICFDYLNISKSKAHCVLVTIIYLILTTNPLLYAVGIRNGCAFVLVVLGFYLYEVRKSSRLFVTCIIISSIFIHRSALLPLFVWMILPIFKKSPKTIIVILSTFLLSVSFFIDLLSPIFSFGGFFSQLFMEVISTIESYQELNDYNIDNSSSLYSKTYLYMSITLFGLCAYRSYYTLYIINNGVRKRTNRLFCSAHSMFLIAILFSIVALCMMSVLVINGSRFLVLANLCLYVPFIYSMNSVQFNYLRCCKTNFFITDKLILFCSISVFFLNCYALAWGTGSFYSILLGSLAGVLIPIINIF